MTPKQRATSRRSMMGACIVAALLVIFYAIAWSAVSSHSATIDEPLHAVSAFLQAFHDDFRVDAEDPPLWKYWAMLPHRMGSLHTASPPLPTSLVDADAIAYPFSARLLYQSPENDGAAFINRSRAAMLVVGVALGTLVALWAWRIAGMVAAIVACVLYALDPNFLAHAPLVKNDVGLSLMLFALAFVTWSVGRRARIGNVLLLCILCGIALTVKFSAVLVGPIVAASLFARALMRTDWLVLHRSLKARGSRLLASLAICMLASVVSVTLIWASYGFRFAPTRSPAVLLDLSRQVEAYKLQNFYIRHARWPNDQERRDEPVPVAARVAMFAQEHRLLPQPWIYGMLFTYRSTLLRPTFILDQRGLQGHWYYFPLAMLFKTPLATIGAGLLVLVATALHKPRHPEPSSAKEDGTGWTLTCLLIPLVLYFASAICSDLNLGLRHVLPIYPFIYVLIGLAAARMHRLHARRFMHIAVTLAIVLVVETMSAYPHYISFFNFASRSHRLHLLSDSNFDWGQDLPYVAEWQQRHPTIPLYLGYLGGVDPAFYGIRYASIPGGYTTSRPQWPPATPGVVAISATLLQGVNCSSECVELYAPFRGREPREIIGDTIYVYDWPLRELR